MLDLGSPIAVSDFLSVFGLLCLSSLMGVGIARVLAGHERTYGVAAAIGAAVGPALLGWFTANMMSLLPGLPTENYAVAIWCVFGLGGVIGAIREGPRLAALGKKMAQALIPTPLRALAVLLLWAILAFGVATLLVFAKTVPLYGNDALEYASVARKVYLARDFAIYPIVDLASGGGLYAGWTHPPGFLGLLVASNIIQGDADNAGAIRLVAPYFAAIQILLIASLAGLGRRLLAAALAGIALLGTPFYFGQVMENSIDPMRMATFTAAMLAFWLLAQGPALRPAILTGIAVGMAHYSHSIGLLTLGFGLPLFALVSRGAIAPRAATAAVSSLIGLAIVSPALLRNIKIFGSPLIDSVRLWTFPQLRYDERLAHERFISTDWERLANGVFKGWSHTELFGVAYWALLAALTWAAFKINWARFATKTVFDPDFRSSPLGTFLILFAGFMGFFVVTAVAGVDLAIKNARYLMTSLPFVVAATALLVTSPLERVRETAP